MIEIELTGNVGKQEDVKLTQREDGSSYLRFSLHAENRGKDGAWFTVYYNCKADFAQYIKQGMKLLVKGDYKDSLYTSKNSTIGIDRVVNARVLEFMSSGQQQSATPVTPAAPAPPQEEDSDEPF